MAKSTLSSWLKDVALTDEHRGQLEQRQVLGGQRRGQAVHALRVARTAQIQGRAATEVGGITDRELFLLGVTAYWCEGSKAKPWSSSAQVAFINSDATLIRLFLRWLALIGVPESALVFTVSIHERADVAAAHRYWSGVVGKPSAAFRKPSLKRHNPKTVRRNTGEAYVGCLTIGVRRSADLNRRIAGWWQGIESGLDALPYDDGHSGVV